jgi:hypothetical protein
MSYQSAIGRDRAGKTGANLGAETIALWRYPRKREHAGKSS